MTILRHGAYQTLYDMPLFINWPLTFMCNYNCSYCFGHEKFDRANFPPPEKYKIAINNIARLNRPLYDVTLVGGEPTIHPYFFQIFDGLCENLGKRLNRIMITTNGSQSQEFFRKLAPHARNVETVINISLHTDHVKLDHIISLVREFSRDMNFAFSLMYNPAKLEFVEEVYCSLCKLRSQFPFDLNVNTLREPPDFSRPDKRYTPAMVERQEQMVNGFKAIAAHSQTRYQSKLRLEPHEFTEYLENGQLKRLEGGNRHLRFNDGLLNFKGMHCVAGSHMLRIEPNGAIRGLVCDHAKPVGNIFDPNLPNSFLDMRLVSCAKPNCGCQANDIVPKFRDRREAENFIEIVRNKQKICCGGEYESSRETISAARGLGAIQQSDVLEPLQDMIELILQIRPDVEQTFTGPAEKNMVGILNWALTYGRNENLLIARLEPEILATLKEISRRAH